MAKVNVPAPGGTFAGATTDRGRTPGGRFNGDGISGFVSTVLTDSILWIGTNPPTGTQYILWINTEDGRWYGRWNDGDSTQWVDLSLPFGEGLPGPQGPTGDRGITGSSGQGIPTAGTADQILLKVDGTDYNTYWGDRPADGLNVLTGTIDPVDLSDGVDGEFFINTTSYDIFGPKAGGAWPAGVSLIGPTGAAGTDGRTILNGVVAPTTEGVDGDFYIDTVTDTIYGPKAGGSWPSGVPLVGPTGSAGADGSTVLNGVVAPTTEGVDGDFYIDTVTDTYYGPKSGGSWPAGTSLVGPAGGGVPTGGTAAQVLSKIDGTDYNTEWVTPSGGGTGIVADDEYLVTGDATSGYETIEDAITQVNTDGPFTWDAPAKIKILTRAITIAATVIIPQFVSVIGQNVHVHTTHATGHTFQLSGYNRMYGLEYVGGNASNTTNYFFYAGNNTDITIINCHLYGNDTDGFMRFLFAEGGAFARINAERCLINYRGVAGYAFNFNNTGTSTRFVDCWLENVFTDSYANFSGSATFGGNIQTTNCRDFRVKRCTIRGRNANYTGVRLSGASDIMTMNHCNLDSYEDVTQTGFDIYGVSGSKLIWSDSTAKVVDMSLGTEEQLIQINGNKTGFRGFSAKRISTAQTIAADTEDTIVCNSETFDTESGYSTGTGEFTVPASLDGQYMRFEGSCRINASEEFLVSIYVGSTKIAQQGSNVDTNLFQQVSSGPRLVSTGQVYSFRIFVSSTSKDVSVDERTWFAGYVL